MIFLGGGGEDFTNTRQITGNVSNYLLKKFLRSKHIHRDTLRNVSNEYLYC